MLFIEHQSSTFVSGMISFSSGSVEEDFTPLTNEVAVIAITFLGLNKKPPYKGGFFVFPQVLSPSRLGIQKE